MSRSAKHKPPVDTGIKELMGGLFESPAMQDALAKMEQMQGPVAQHPNQKSGAHEISQNKEYAQEYTQQETHVDTHIDMDINMGVHVNTEKDTQNYTDADIGIKNGMDIGIDTHMYTHVDAQSPSGFLKDVPAHVFAPLSAGQGRMLIYLIEAGNVANRVEISREIGMAVISVAKNLKILERDGYIKRGTGAYYNHQARGFTYTVNINACRGYYEKIRGVQLHSAVSIPMDTQAYTQAYTQPDMGITPPTLFSSRRDLKPSTTENPGVLELIKDPEMGYWREKGVNGRQLNTWSDEFQMPIEQVVQSLKYCRYDMVILNQEEDKQITNPMNWFYKVMQRSGLYPKPTGYKSLAELRAEQLELAVKEASAIRQRVVNATKGIEFERIMSAPDSKEYQDLYVKCSSFAVESGGFALENEMKNIFMGIQIDSLEQLAK